MKVISPARSNFFSAFVFFLLQFWTLKAEISRAQREPLIYISLNVIQLNVPLRGSQRRDRNFDASEPTITTNVVRSARSDLVPSMARRVNRRGSERRVNLKAHGFQQVLSRTRSMQVCGSKHSVPVKTSYARALHLCTKRARIFLPSNSRVRRGSLQVCAARGSAHTPPLFLSPA